VELFQISGTGPGYWDAREYSSWARTDEKFGPGYWDAREYSSWARTDEKFGPGYWDARGCTSLQTGRGGTPCRQAGDTPKL
jgi:hypothetical protein